MLSFTYFWQTVSWCPFFFFKINVHFVTFWLFRVKVKLRVKLFIFLNFRQALGQNLWWEVLHPVVLIMGLTIKWWVPFCLTLYYLVSFVQAVWFCCWKLTTVFLYNVSATCIMPKLDTLLKRTEYIYYGTNHHRWGVRFTSDKWRIDIFPSVTDKLSELKSYWPKHIYIYM